MRDHTQRCMDDHELCCYLKMCCFSGKFNIIGYQAKVIDFTPTEIPSGTSVQVTIRMSNFAPQNPPTSTAKQVGTVVMFGDLQPESTEAIAYEGTMAVLRVTTPKFTTPGDSVIYIYPGGHSERVAMVVGKDGTKSIPLLKVLDENRPQIVQYHMASGANFAVSMGGDEVVVTAKKFPVMNSASDLQVLFKSREHACSQIDLCRSFAMEWNLQPKALRL